MPAEQVVYVVDDDDAVRSSICMLLESYGIAARPYASGTAFLADLSPKQGCLLVDVEMPGMNGLELLDRLRGSRKPMPVIVDDGRPDEPGTAGGGSSGGNTPPQALRVGGVDGLVARALGRCGFATG